MKGRRPSHAARGLLALALSARFVSQAGAADVTASAAPADVDAAVIKVVVNDIRMVAQDAAPFALSPTRPRTIHVTLADAATCPFDHVSGVQELRAALPRTLRSAFDRANADVENRSVTPDSLEASGAHGAPSPVSPQKQKCGAECLTLQDCVWVYPPGYSPRGSFAVVRLYLPEMLHPSVAVYFLRARGGDWEIVNKKFVTFI